MTGTVSEAGQTGPSARTLFGLLDADAFTVFAGANRHLYERAVLAIYEELFRSDLSFPTEAEVVHVIYQCLAREPELWREDEAATPLDRLEARGGRRVRRRRESGTDQDATGTTIVRSRQIYTRLRQTGWLDETRYGLKVTVEMPSGAMRLAEFLCSFKDGPAEQLGGLVVEVRNAVDAVRRAAAENALGLNKAARDAVAFGRYLRTVLSALREVDRQVKGSDTLGGRLRHYFEDFVERVLLRDYTAISTTAHPYRYRRSILNSIAELEDSEIDLASIADAYAEARLASTIGAARDLVHEDLQRIRGVFERIEEAFDAIQNHRARLETRLRNVVRYAGRRTGFMQRSEALILRLDRSLDTARHGSTGATALIEQRQAIFSPSLLAQPRGTRTAICGSRLAILPPDPIHELRRRLEREHLDRLTVTPAQVARFLERRVGPFGTAEAGSLPIEGLDDFLAFEALRLMVGAGSGDGAELPRGLRDRFQFTASKSDGVNNDWLACPGFVVRRLDDTVGMEAHGAR